jgi:hypothetical protein
MPNWHELLEFVNRPSLNASLNGDDQNFAISGQVPETVG